MLDREFIAAYGSVAGTDGSRVSGDGNFSCTRSGKGDYAITLDQGLAAGECVCVATLRGGTSGVLRIVQTSATSKQVLCFAVDGTTAGDLNFDFVFLRTPNIA
jgi:hypothetical protein